MLYFSRWKTISIWAVVLLGVLFARPNLFPQSVAVRLAGLAAEEADDARSRPAGRFAHPAADRAAGPGRRTAARRTRDDIRTLLRDAKIGYTGLTGTGQTVQVRIRDAGAARRGQDGAVSR